MKHAVITGANAGIGFATAKALLQKGFKISMFCRNLEKAETAKKELIVSTKNDNVDIYQVDFSSLKSIEKACVTFKNNYPKLDVLINNAGATFSDYTKTEDGIEMTMAVNHFGYFATCYHLLPLLKEEARIINVASKSHFGGKVDFKTINEEKGYFVYSQYEHSKLANVLFTKHLASKLESKGITVNCLHPGVVKTKIGNKSGNIFFGFAWSLLSFFGLNLEEGAATSVYLASSLDVGKITGMYFDKKKPYKGSKLAQSTQLQEELWKWSETKSGLVWGI